jgi:hypothetical protein
LLALAAGGCLLAHGSISDWNPIGFRGGLGGGAISSRIVWMMARIF